MKCNRGLVLVQQASNSTIGPRGTEIVHGLLMGFGVCFFFVTVVESYISYSQGLLSDDSFASCS
jgi:hypothetical protein